MTTLDYVGYLMFAIVVWLGAVIISDSKFSGKNMKYCYLVAIIWPITIPVVLIWFTALLMYDLFTRK